MHTFLTFASFAAASATVVVRAADPESAWVLVSAGLGVAFGAVTLSVAPSRRAREHNDLARRFIVLEREIVKAGQEQPPSERVDEWIGRRLSIEEDEPPLNHMLNVACHNELVMAMGKPRHEMVYIPWWKRTLMSVGFDPYNAEYVKKLAPSKRG